MASREKRRKRKREPSPESKPTRRSSSQRKRNREPWPEASSPIPWPEPSSPIPSLPYDLVLLCVARVSRLYYPTLCLVSKSFRSLVSSPELYKTRSLFGFTESCLYVCLQDLGWSADWHTLCRKPDKTTTKTTGSTKSGYALAKVHVPNPPPPSRFGSVVAVGSNIYNIAKPRSLNVLPRVSILDCKSHTAGWIEAPSLPVELHSFSSSVVDHKIFVTGFHHRLKKNSFEVFDTDTRVWDSVSTDERQEMFVEKTVSIDGKFHVVTDEEVLAYDPKQGKWDMVGRGMGGLKCSDAYCVIGNVLYSVFEGVFRWYDTESRRWRDLKGLVGLPKISRGGGREFVRLGDYDGKMVVSWGHAFWHYYRRIWCAEIALQRKPDTSEIWGKVEWFDQLLKVNINYQVEKLLSTTL